MSCTDSTLRGPDSPLWWSWLWSPSEEQYLGSIDHIRLNVRNLCHSHNISHLDDIMIGWSTNLHKYENRISQSSVNRRMDEKISRLNLDKPAPVGHFPSAPFEGKCCIVLLLNQYPNSSETILEQNGSLSTLNTAWRICYCSRGRVATLRRIRSLQPHPFSKCLYIK